MKDIPDISEELLQEALQHGRDAARGGQVANYIPELGCADPAAVGLAVCTTTGATLAAGDVSADFTLQSASKVFSLAYLLQLGDTGLWENVDMEPSGDAFHSIVRLEEEHGRPRNPLINAGAIVVSDRLPGHSRDARVDGLQDFLRHAADADGSRFGVDEAVYLSECRTGFRNRALANYMKHFGVVEDPDCAVDTYFRQCAITANVTELARLGLWLARGGVAPDDPRPQLSAADARTVLALMTTCGLYDEVGSFAVRVGIPAKSGVSGAMLGVVPGRLAIACYGPALGARGNSLAGIAMLELLADRLGLSSFQPH